MRVIAMLNPFMLVGADIATERERVETLRELYNVKPHIVAALGVGLAAVSAVLSGSAWNAFWAMSITIVCLLFRIVIEYLFVRRVPGKLEPKWIHLFVFGSLFSGFGWGVAGAFLVYATSPETKVIILAVACAIVQGTAARAYMMPGTAFINIIFVLGLVGIAAVADDRALFIPGLILYFSFLSSFVVIMVRYRLRQLLAEQKTDQLLQEIIEKNDLLRVANERLAEVALQDALTGLANRRKFDTALLEALEITQRDRTPLSLMLIDVDHFKAFNDTYGHQAGDLCLQQVAQAILMANSDEANLVARYGGEEFVVILPLHDKAMGMTAAERTRQAVEMADLSSHQHKPPAQTISIGLVSCAGGPGTTLDTLLKAADEALYQAKRQGRNRVCAVQNGEHLAA